MADPQGVQGGPRITLRFWTSPYTVSQKAKETRDQWLSAKARAWVKYSATTSVCLLLTLSLSLLSVRASPSLLLPIVGHHRSPPRQCATATLSPSVLRRSSVAPWSGPQRSPSLASLCHPPPLPLALAAEQGGRCLTVQSRATGPTFVPAAARCLRRGVDLQASCSNIFGDFVYSRRARYSLTNQPQFNRL